MASSSFTRGGDDVQLPLSSKYRKDLQALCDLFSKGARLPDDVKKDDLKAMCKKLDYDNDNIKSSIVDSRRLLMLVSVVAFFLLYSYRDKIGLFLAKLRPKASYRLSSSTSLPSPGNAGSLKEERLKYYNSLNSNSSSNNSIGTKSD